MLFMHAEQNAASRTEQVRRAIEQSELAASPPHPCSYLPGQVASHLAFQAAGLAPGIYHSLMDLNFRRSGSVFYRPVCEHCEQCKAIRVVVNEFAPHRAQRRCWKRNQDLTAEAGKPVPTKEKHQLYLRYLERRHNRQMAGEWSEFCQFLYDSPVETIEVVYRLADRLIGVGIVDVEAEALSTVYCYFDPEATVRSLGVFNVLWTIEHCRREMIPHLYLGYYIRECKKMNYKADYQPCEVLGADGCWTRLTCVSD